MSETPRIFTLFRPSEITPSQAESLTAGRCPDCAKPTKRVPGRDGERGLEVVSEYCDSCGKFWITEEKLNHTPSLGDGDE